MFFTFLYVHHVVCWYNCPVGWSSRIHRLFLSGRASPHHHLHRNGRPGFDTKQFDGKVLVMRELWGMRSRALLQLLPGPLLLWKVEPNRVLVMCQIELNFVLLVNWIGWNRTVLKFTVGTCVEKNCLKWNCYSMLNWIVLNNCFLTLKVCTYTKPNCLK